VRGHDRWAPVAAMAVVLGVQLLVSSRLVPGPTLLLPGFEAALVLGLLVANDRRMDVEERVLRGVSVGLIGFVALVNTASLVRLVHRLVAGDSSGRALLAAAAGVWLTNVVVFGLVYWELDRGGPLGRLVRWGQALPDLQFPQDADHSQAPADWRPLFVDYLFTSLTASTAFSPTDVMPLTRRAKLFFGTQALVSLLTVGLVAARAVNVLP